MKFSKSVVSTNSVAAFIFASVMGVSSVNAQEASKIALESDQAKLGYTVGTQIASDLLRGGILDEIDVEAYLAAQRDVLSGVDARMTPEEMQAAQQAFTLKQQQAIAAVANENKAKGDEYLAKNKEVKGVQVTESGLQYEVLTKGKGAQPTAQSTVTVHYAGSLIDGTVFDSSYERNQPADFPVSGVIPGFSEGLQLMSEGAKYKFTIPADIAYGEQGPASIGPNQVLIFEVELIAVK